VLSSYPDAVRLASALVAALCVLAFPLLGAGPAGAETWSATDPARDVTLVEVTHCPDACEESMHVVDRPGADITRLDVNYRKRLLRVIITKAAASTGKGSRVDLSVGLAAPGKQLFGMGVTFPVGRKPRVHILSVALTDDGSDSDGAEEEGGRVRCRAASAADHGRRLRVDIPAECLGTPDWVRLDAVAVGLLPSGPHRLALLLDDALTDGRDRGARARLSPRISRG
jgi:hypothetical protein